MRFPRMHFQKDDPYLPLWAKWQRFKTGMEMRRIMREDKREMEENTSKVLQKAVEGCREQDRKSSDEENNKEGMKNEQPKSK